MNKLIGNLVVSAMLAIGTVSAFSAEPVIDLDGKNVVSKDKAITLNEQMPAPNLVQPVGLPEKSESSPKIKSKNDAYEYPIKPGTVEWKELRNHEEMLRVCQIPPNTLKNMSTEGLIETILNYPLFWDMTAYDNLRVGFSEVSSRFNGIPELFQRADVGEKLLATYRSINPAAFPKDSGKEEFEHVSKFYFIELLVAQAEVQNRFNKPQLKELRQIIADKYVILKQLPEVNGSINKEILAILSKSYDNPVYYPAYDVKTPKGHAVVAWRLEPTDELTWKDVVMTNEYWKAAFPSATLEGDSTRKYDCHSYAWYDQSTSNNRWINNGDQSIYWEDTSYIQVSYAVGGAKISYTNELHSAIFVSGSSPFSGYCRSKWGQGPLMYHPCTVTPYNSSELDIYILRY